MENHVNELYRGLKELRLKQNKSQTMVSEYMGFKLSSSLSHVEAGSKNISVNKLLKWLDVLNIDLINIVLDSKSGLDLKLLHDVVKNCSSEEINDILTKLKDKNG